MRKIHFNHKEELWNSWSHAGGIIIGVAVGSIFLYMCFAKGNGWATAGIILYLFGMLMSYVASTVYHSLSAWSKWKERLGVGFIPFYMDFRHCWNNRLIL